MTQRLLKIDSSNRYKGSVSRHLTTYFAEQFCTHHPDTEVIQRDLGQGVPQLNEPLVEAIRTPTEYLTDAHRELLTFSDELIAEIKSANVLLIGIPMYNFSVPSVLKAYIDLVVRAGETFKFTEYGSVGLLKDTKAFVIVTSGGTDIDSDVDYAGRYMNTLLHFIGISEIQLIKADQLVFGEESKVEAAHRYIDRLFTGAGAAV